MPIAIYRLLLLCYPRGFRDEFGEQLTLVFKDQHARAARDHGRLGLFALWVGVVADVIKVAPMEHASLLLQNVRFSLRTLRKSPLFCAVAIVTTALGVGATTAIFSVVNAVLLKPLPYPDSDRLAAVYLNAAHRGAPRATFSKADYIDLQAHDTAFEQTAAFGAFGRLFTMNGLGEPREVRGVFATAKFFSVFRAEPVIGRLLRAGDDEPGAVRSAVISERLWRDNGTDPNVVNSSVVINGLPHTIIGVAPAGFRYPHTDTDVWAIFPLDAPLRRGPYFLSGVGRLKSSVSASDAQARLQSVPLGVRVGASPEESSLKFAVEPLHQQIVGDVQRMLRLLMGSVGLILLIAIANVANLQIARSAVRGGEFATRLSIGATRGQLARQLLTESVLLSVAGGAVGNGLAWMAVGVLQSSGEGFIPRVDEVAVDLKVLTFALVVSTLAGLLFGLAPALRASSQSLMASLGDSNRSVSVGRRGGRLRDGLAIAQIALSCTLLIVAGLLIKSLVALHSRPLGIESSQVIAAQVLPSGDRYKDDASARAFYEGLIDGVSAIPSVEVASLSSTIPPGRGGFGETIWLEEKTVEEAGSLLLAIVHPTYFRTMGVPLIAGRVFAPSDTAEGPRVAIVSQAFAERHYPGQTAIGRRFKIGGRGRPNAPWLEIVGVVGDVRYGGLATRIEPVFYIPHAQNTMRAMYLLLRTTLPPASIQRDVTLRVASLDRTIPIPRLQRVDDLVYQSVARPRFRTWLVAIFASVALMIAAVGLYGVIAYGVAQRVREFGIRIALGARPSAVSSTVLQHSAKLSVVGIVTGVAGALAMQKVMSGFMVDNTPTDAPTFITVVIVLGFVCLLATYIPARRAARVDPVILLRNQ